MLPIAMSAIPAAASTFEIGSGAVTVGTSILSAISSWHQSDNQTELNIKQIDAQMKKIKSDTKITLDKQAQSHEEKMYGIQFIDRNFQYMSETERSKSLDIIGNIVSGESECYVPFAAEY